MADLRTDGELPLLLRAEQAAKLLSLGRTTVFQMMASGELPCVRIGRAVRVPRSALERWVRAQSGEPEPTSGADRVGP